MSTQNNTPETAADWFALVREQVGSLRYGVVQITVHERRVTQIERTERLRLEPPAPGAGRRLNG